VRTLTGSALLGVAATVLAVVPAAAVTTSASAGSVEPAAGRTAVQPTTSRAAMTPATVVGSGRAASCTSAKVVKAVRRGGLITFDCGSKPVTITMRHTARVYNDRSRRVVIDGGGLVTLSGAGKRRILYQNTCDKRLVWTTSHCQDQPYPRLVLKDLGLVRGDSTGERLEGGGGGAVFVRGGRLKVVGTRFAGNRCDRTGPDLGGAAIRVLDQHRDEPVRVVRSRFVGGRCANGGARSSIGVSWDIRDSVFLRNRAIGHGANPARAGSPGGGSGGAIYTDGNLFTVRLVGSRIERNRAREGGGAIFFVSNDRSGRLVIDHSDLRRNPSAGFETAGYPGIFFLGRGHPRVTASTLR
jgi:hypothetical protein